jgi:ankyrin repeat protein
MYKKVNTDVNKCRKDSGESPLYIACQEGHLDIVLQLLDKKVKTDVNKCCDDGKYNDVYSLLSHKSISTFGLLVTPQQHQCDFLNVQFVMVNNHHLCFYYCPLRVLRGFWLLLDKKVNTDVNQCRDSGESPLYIACQEGHLDIVLQLLDKKVKVMLHCLSYTCLHLY